eukprot:515628-Amphidinium_carterae.1
MPGMKGSGYPIRLQRDIVQHTLKSLPLELAVHLVGTHRLVRRKEWESSSTQMGMCTQSLWKSEQKHNAFRAFGAAMEHALVRLHQPPFHVYCDAPISHHQ